MAENLPEGRCSTRQQRRAAERLARKGRGAGLDRAELLRIAAAMTEADGSISGVTIIAPSSGEMTFVDAAMLRRGGRA